MILDRLKGHLKLFLFNNSHFADTGVSRYRLAKDINNKFRLFLFLIILFSLLPVMTIADHANCSDVHAAAFLDEPVELLLLFSHGADYNCRDVFQQTPLITATRGASLETMKILL